jgi:hypothetical protein
MLNDQESHMEVDLMVGEEVVSPSFKASYGVEEFVLEDVVGVRVQARIVPSILDNIY